MQSDNTNVAVEKNRVQYVSSTLESGHYPDITVKAGEPVAWTIKISEKNINGCNYKILLQDFNQEHTFESGKNVIKFTPEKIYYDYNDDDNIITDNSLRLWKRKS